MTKAASGGPNFAIAGNVLAGLRRRKLMPQCAWRRGWAFAGKPGNLEYLALPAFRAHLSSMLPDELTSPKQIEMLRAMPGELRLRLAERLYWSARKMKTAGLRAQHPDWPEERLAAEARRIFLDART
jgi:hypothetical protein